MTHADWLKIMQFPPEWTEWSLIPLELAAEQLSGYRLGHEDASEHDRHGAFQWWLQRQPSPDVLIQLAHLTWLDPDPLMAQSVRGCLAMQLGYNAEVGDALSTPYQRV